MSAKQPTPVEVPNDMPVAETTRNIRRKLFPTFRGLTRKPTYGLLLSGGGARAAYQAGVLAYIGEAFPETKFPVLTGVSAGAINAAHIANSLNGYRESTRDLVKLWKNITADQVFESGSGFDLVKSFVNLGRGKEIQGIVDTSPLRKYLSDHLNCDADGCLSGIQRRLDKKSLQGFAIITTKYSTGQTVSWVQGGDISAWERPNRIGIQSQLTIEHIMASTSLPFIFPAVELGSEWYGDGGIRLSAPLAPVVQLGAERILAVSTRYARSRTEANDPSSHGYPPNSQLFSLLINSVFLDSLDQDAMTMDRINALLDQLPLRKRLGLRPIELLVLRPSLDLGRLAGEYEDQLTGALKLIAKGIGLGKSKSPDWLSMLLFYDQYVDRLLDVGFHDAKDQHQRIARFLSQSDRPPLREEADLSKMSHAVIPSREGPSQ